MGKFLRTLAKVGLVELEEAPDGDAAADEPGLDPEAIDRILAHEAEQAPPGPGASRPASTSGRGPAAAPAEAPEEGRPFEAIYAEAQITASPFSAEKLLRLLDGLQAMEPAMRQAAVRAMDQADEAWTIDDAVLDAERKVRALDDAGAELDARVRAVQAKAEAELAARDDYQAKAVASIRKQISDLEQMLQDELNKVAEEKAAIRANLDATRATCAREQARMDGEKTRLKQIPHMFAPAPGTTKRPA